MCVISSIKCGSRARGVRRDARIPPEEAYLMLENIPYLVPLSLGMWGEGCVFLVALLNT